MPLWRPFRGLCPILGLLLVCAGAPLLARPPENAQEFPAPGTLLELQEVESLPLNTWKQRFAQKIKTDLGARAGAFSQFGPEVVFKQVLKHYLAARIASLGLSYASEDAKGLPRIYSGRIFLPGRTPGSPPTRLPLVIYQHGTETRRHFVPSEDGGDETVLGALGAEAGPFAVAMPDGDGMGADASSEMHAYCHAQTTSKCLIDMIRAIEGSGSRIFDGINYVWDGRLFIMGYSEGGYIALAAVKELETNPAYRDIHLTGAACMGAPFDLSRFTRSLLLATAGSYDRPYIPAYLLAAWAHLYPDTFRFQDAINPKLLETSSLPGQEGGIHEWLDGVLGGDQITLRMQARLTGQRDQLVTARAVVNEAWAQANVDYESSQVNQLLAANSLVGGWTPTVPVLLAHDPFDECVSFFNSQNLYDDWVAQGLKPMAIIRMAVGSHGPGHVGGAVLGVPSAFIWLAAGMPSSMMNMAVNTLQAKVLELAPTSLAPVISRAAELATQEQDQNRAEFPLSRIDYHPKGFAEPWTVSLADPHWAVGKVKFYTLAPFPQFPGQQPLAGHTDYPKFVGQLKRLGDAFPIQPDEPCYFAVYPKNGAVALTLRFAGMAGAAPLSGVVNLKQGKSKWLGSSKVAIGGDQAFLQAHVHKDSYEHPASPNPFLSLP